MVRSRRSATGRLATTCMLSPCISNALLLHVHQLCDTHADFDVADEIAVASNSVKLGRRGRSGQVATTPKRSSLALDTAEISNSDDEIVVQPAMSSRRIVRGVAIPSIDPMARDTFQKPASKSKSPTDSSLSSVANTSRDSSTEYETPGTTPATSTRGAASTSKRKRSNLGHVQQIEDSEDDDEALALRLQEEEYTRGGAEPAKKRVKISIADSEDESELSEPESMFSMDSVVKPQPSSSKKQPVKSIKAKGKAPRTASSRGQKAKLPLRTARTSAGKKLKIEDSELSDLDVAESEDEFIVEDSEAGTSGVSDTESDVPLSTIRPAASRTPVKSRGRGRGGRPISTKRRGRRFGNITEEDADNIATGLANNVAYAMLSRKEKERVKLEKAHPSIKSMWKDLEKIPVIKPVAAAQPESINRKLKPFQLEGLDWMVKQEQTQYKGGLLGDEMGMGKTIQAVSLIMSDYPQKDPTLVVVPPVVSIAGERNYTRNAC